MNLYYQTNNSEQDVRLISLQPFPQLRSSLGEPSQVAPHLRRNILQPGPGARFFGDRCHETKYVCRNASIHTNLLSHTVCTRTMHPTRIFWVCSHQSSANSNPSQSFPISFSHPFSLSLALAGGGQHQRPPQLIHTHLPEATCVCVVCVCA